MATTFLALVEDFITAQGKTMAEVATAMGYGAKHFTDALYSGNMPIADVKRLADLLQVEASYFFPAAYSAKELEPIQTPLPHWFVVAPDGYVLLFTGNLLENNAIDAFLRSGQARINFDWEMHQKANWRTEYLTIELAKSESH